MEAHYYSEVEADALLVAKVNHPGAIPLGSVVDIDDDVIWAIVTRQPHALFLLGGGPPCTDVSLVNAFRKGANGAQSILRDEFERIYQRLCAFAPGRVVGLMECTRMDAADRVAYDSVFHCTPFELCASPFSCVTRPRWWWSSRALVWPSGTTETPSPSHPGVRQISPSGM